MEGLVIGVDVGTGSARAGVFDSAGRCLGRAERPIRLHRPQPHHAEQSSEEIWQAICEVTRKAVAAAAADPGAIHGIGFDATCSLVVRDKAGQPVSISSTGSDEWDTIVWLDHRAVDEAEACTRSGHPVLDLSVTEVQLNAPLAAPVPALVQQFVERVDTQKVAEGVWFLAGGSHNSVAIEMKDHIVVVETPLYDKLGIPDTYREQVNKEIAASVPLGRFGTADEVAKAVLYLASDESRWTVGTEIVVDGGRLLNG